MSVSALALLFTALVACTLGQTIQPTSDPHPTIESSSPVDSTVIANGDVVQLLDLLRQRGITLENPDDSRAAFLYPVRGVFYRVDSGWLALHPFPSPQAAERRARAIPREQSRSIIDWVDQPHFYRCKSTLVLYLGRDARIMQALTGFCGPEFAGSQ